VGADLPDVILAGMSQANTMLGKLKNYTWIWMLALCAFVAWYGLRFDAGSIEQQGHYNFMSLVPALATLAICFVTRNVILALFMGIVLGGLVTTQYNIIREFLIPSIGSERYAPTAAPGILHNMSPQTSSKRGARRCSSPGSWVSFFIRAARSAPFSLERRSGPSPIGKRSLTKNLPISSIRPHHRSQRSFHSMSGLSMSPA
jgi:hypothetical protein